MGAGLASLGWSQETIHIAPPPPGEPGNFFFNTTAGAMKVMAIDGIEGKTVTGVPYSAEQTTQTTQTLADGNRIVNTSKAKVYRDQQGRRRVEQSMGNIGGLAAAETQTMIMIDDPVAKVHYTLHTADRTAEKMETNVSVNGPGVREGMAMSKLKQEVEAAQTQVRTAMVRRDTVSGPGVMGFRTKLDAEQAARKEEDLGPQNMEGVLVQGKRFTTTIPAGAIGNDRAIQIVEERWYSPELQMNIMTKHSDPRMGETVFTVTGVSRANPDASLFQLPADYQVNSTRNMVYKFSTTTNP
jgi:hypothetical protein